MKRKGILLFNPRSTPNKPRIPNSVLQIAACIDGDYPWVIIDGNLEIDPWKKIESYLKTGEYFLFGSTVMPGPQLKQAIPYAKKIKEQFPEITTVWGGYFPGTQYRVVMESGWVDYVISGPGDTAFPQLLQCLENKTLPFLVKNLIFKHENEIVINAKESLADPDLLKPFPYEKLNSFYPLNRYLAKTFLGKKTIAYHSSFGCPFTCSFCAVVPIYNARWKGMSAERIYHDVKWLKDTHGGDAIEFHDNNFFVSEKRTLAFSKLIKKENMSWWGEGRIDTIDKYSDDTLHEMRESGCKMIFFGAETGNDEVLKLMDKGGTQTGEQILSFAERIGRFDIIPEYSFVLGTPAKDSETAQRQLEEDIAFIRQVKKVNPATEIIIYVYSPVAIEGSELYEKVKETGFRFPQKLEDWIEPAWENFDLRKNPLTPWMTPAMVNRIKNFETVLNGYFPTVSDSRLSGGQRKLISLLSSWRYKTDFTILPLEIKVLQKLWQYRQPEITGF